jgi:hypothetical protein
MEMMVLLVHFFRIVEHLLIKRLLLLLSLLFGLRGILGVDVVLSSLWQSFFLMLDDIKEL